MKTKTIIKIIISAILWIIIDQILSINQIIKEALDPLMVGPFLEPIKPLVFLCFYLAEIAGTYGILNKLLDLLLKDEN
ncbi:MAG: hypothetical protein Q7S33_05555 [Nanoarchaeota archaeon]|nr:hypothetical protein [Nanoarchaeota archaeon]